MKTANPYVLTSNGREYKYQVMPLSEDFKPAKYIDGISPVDTYGLVDIENMTILTTFQGSRAEAESIMLEKYEYEE